MVDREILEAISELGESDLKRLRILIDNKLGPTSNEQKISYRQKLINVEENLVTVVLMDRIGMLSGQKMVKEILNILKNFK